MKVSTIAYIITGLSFIVAIGSSIFISPYSIITLLCTGMIYLSAKRIKDKEDKGEKQ